MKGLIFLLIGLTAVVAVDCCHCCKKAAPVIPADVISGTGTVKQVGVEGGFFGIVGDDGQNYDPQNLPEDLKVDGLKVKFQLKKSENQASFHMWGIVVDVVKIEKN
jgi:hypothetical protein